MKHRKLPKTQTKLVNDPPSLVTKVTLDPTVKYRCPFCLGEYPSYGFEVILKSSKKSKKAECPECHQVFLWSTLTQDMTPVEYAEWLYSYMGYGGYKKVSWEKLKTRLKEMGIANTFWDAWHNIKAKTKGIGTYLEKCVSDEDVEKAYLDYQKDNQNDT